eukprot:6264085-Amphidinium_carterae.1
MQWLSTHKLAGLKVRLAVYGYFKVNPQAVSSSIEAIGSECNEGLTDLQAIDCRRQVAQSLGISSSSSPLCNLWDSFFTWWCVNAGDPDDQVPL